MYISNIGFLKVNICIIFKYYCDYLKFLFEKKKICDYDYVLKYCSVCKGV